MTLTAARSAADRSSGRPALPAVDDLMNKAVAERVFSGATLLVSRQFAVCHHRAYGHDCFGGGRRLDLGSVFDLASLTKPLATTLALMHLTHTGQIDPHDRLGQLLRAFGGTDRAAVSIADLMRHRSGLPHYRAYYRHIIRVAPRRRPDALKRLLAAEGLVCPIDTETCYSDVGFMILKWVVESVAARPLEELLARTVYPSLGVAQDAAPFFIAAGGTDSRQLPAAVATERCRWRKRLVKGEVHDPNAWVMGGVAGHAGLFASADAVHHLLVPLLAGHVPAPPAAPWPPSLIRRFTAPGEGGRRPMGFDVPAAVDASCGRHFSALSFGHLGFTGTSFWVDPVSSIIVVLLTNRVHSGRVDSRMRSFRPRLHDAVCQGLGTVSRYSATAKTPPAIGSGGGH
jgi:CubicO group peptidase (beta-lactamase class C family)